MKKSLLIILITALFLGCTSKKNEKKDKSHLIAINYMQTSAEVKALYYQAFNLAKLKLDTDLINSELSPNRAIVVDVDETVLVTIPYNATNFRDSRDYPKGWSEWVNEATGKAVNGSLAFLQYAEAKGVEIFYITNRRDNLLDSTYKNLKALRFPVKKEHLFMKKDNSNKELRRQKVLKDYRVVLYIGDNLVDFPGAFDKEFTRDIKGREAQVKKNKEKFGDKWIILPNSVYGDWENVIYNHNWNKTKEKMIKEREGILEY